MQWNRQRLVVLYAGIVLILTGVLLIRGSYKGGLFEPGKFNDFRAYHLAAQGALRGDLVPAYEDALRPFQYPPAFAFLLSPLGVFPYRAALAVWMLINTALVLAIFARLDAILCLSLSAEAKLAGFLLAYRMLESDFANGNANVVVLAFVLGAFWLARGGWEALGGGALAAAILAKVSPALALPWVLLRRRWRFALGLLLCLSVLGLLVPAAILGPQGFLRAWSAWSEVTLAAVEPWSAAYEKEAGEGYVPGQSLRALLHRLLRRSDATAHDGKVMYIYWLDLPKGGVDALYIVLALAILALILRAAWRRAPAAGPGWSAGEIAAACAAMALLAPLSRKAHFVLIWPAAVLGFEAWWGCGGKAILSWRAALWATAFVLVVGTSPGLLGRGASTLVLGYCPLSAAAACLLPLVTHPRFFVNIQ